MSASGYQGICQKQSGLSIKRRHRSIYSLRTELQAVHIGIRITLTSNRSAEILHTKKATDKDLVDVRGCIQRLNKGLEAQGVVEQARCLGAKLLATKPDDLCSVPRSHKVEGKKTDSERVYPGLHI